MLVPSKLYRRELLWSGFLLSLYCRVSSSISESSSGMASSVPLLICFTEFSFSPGEQFSYLLCSTASLPEPDQTHSKDSINRNGNGPQKILHSGQFWWQSQRTERSLPWLQPRRIEISEKKKKKKLRLMFMGRGDPSKPQFLCAASIFF